MDESPAMRLTAKTDKETAFKNVKKSIDSHLRHLDDNEKYWFSFYVQRYGLDLMLKYREHKEEE